MLRLHQSEPVPQTPAMDPAQALQTQLFCKKDNQTNQQKCTKLLISLQQLDLDNHVKVGETKY